MGLAIGRIVGEHERVGGEGPVRLAEIVGEARALDAQAAALGGLGLEPGATLHGEEPLGAQARPAQQIVEVPADLQHGRRDHALGVEDLEVERGGALRVPEPIPADGGRVEAERDRPGMEVAGRARAVRSLGGAEPRGVRGLRERVREAIQARRLLGQVPQALGGLLGLGLEHEQGGVVVERGDVTALPHEQLGDPAVERRLRRGLGRGERDAEDADDLVRPAGRRVVAAQLAEREGPQRAAPRGRRRPARRVDGHRDALGVDEQAQRLVERLTRAVEPVEQAGRDLRAAGAGRGAIELAEPLAPELHELPVAPLALEEPLGATRRFACPWARAARAPRGT